MATALPWQPQPPTNLLYTGQHRNLRRALTIRAFRRSDMNSFARRMASGEAWKDAWRTANDGFEQFLFEAKKTAERIDRRYSVSGRLGSMARSAADRAREIDREFEIGLRWRTFSTDFSRNWPRGWNCSREQTRESTACLGMSVRANQCRDQRWQSLFGGYVIWRLD